MDEDSKRMFAFIQDKLNEIAGNSQAPRKIAYSNQQLAEMLGVCPNTLLKWRSNRLIGFSQIGSVIAYSEDDVREFLRNNHVKSESEIVGLVQ